MIETQYYYYKVSKDRMDSLSVSSSCPVPALALLRRAYQAQNIY